MQRLDWILGKLKPFNRITMIVAIKTLLSAKQNKSLKFYWMIWSLNYPILKVLTFIILAEYSESVFEMSFKIEFFVLFFDNYTEVIEVQCSWSVIYFVDKILDLYISGILPCSSHGVLKILNMIQMKYLQFYFKRFTLVGIVPFLFQSNSSKAPLYKSLFSSCLSSSCLESFKLSLSDESKVWGISLKNDCYIYYCSVVPYFPAHECQ